MRKLGSSLEEEAFEEVANFCVVFLAISLIDIVYDEDVGFMISAGARRPVGEHKGLKAMTVRLLHGEDIASSTNQYLDLV